MSSNRKSPRPGASLRATALLALVLALAFTASSCGRSQLMGPQVGATPRNLAAQQASEGAVHVEGVSESGALWALDRPAVWNGDLVIYLHGYTDPRLPISMPNYGEVRDSLLARGFAVAASSFSTNGYAVPEGVRESHELRGVFQDRVAAPRRTFLLGRSLGGIVGLILAQKYGQQYDGALLASGPVGGITEEVQYMGDIRVLFDVLYPGVIGGDLYHPPATFDPNAVVRAVMADPQKIGIIQRLARRPLPGNTTQELVSSLVQILGFGVQGGGDLYERCHEHSYFENATWRYDSPSLPPEVIEAINARVARYTREPDAAEYLAHWGEPEGPFQLPVWTLHTSRDPIIPVFHEDLLARVAAGPTLHQEVIDRYGHDNYRVGEIMIRFAGLVQTVDEADVPVARGVSGGTAGLAH